MKKLLCKISLLLLAFTLIFGFVVPKAAAQEDLFDTLEEIKKEVGEKQTRIGEGGETETVSVQLIDFSRDSEWGGLSGDIVGVLTNEGYESIDDVKDDSKEDLEALLLESDLPDAIEKKEGESSADYSERVDTAISSMADSILYAYRVKSWGNLSSDIISILEVIPYTVDTGKSTVENLNDLAKEYKYSQSKGNVDDLTTELKKIEGLSADDIDSIIYEIRFKGESQIQSAILAVAKVMRNLIGGLAILWIVISGVQMIFAGGEESKITEQKHAITYAVIGLIAILLLERGIVILYGVPGVERGFATTGEGISQEIYGVISFIKAIIGAAAILMIVISGFKIIATTGEEEKITQQKKSILWVVVGLLVIIINKFIVENLFIQPAANKGLITQTNVQNIINQIGTVTEFLLGFVGLIAFAALIYGAGTMIANFGNDEVVQKSKKVIKNAIIGIIVIISAYAIVATVIKFE